MIPFSDNDCSTFIVYNFFESKKQKFKKISFLYKNYIKYYHLINNIKKNIYPKKDFIFNY